MSMKELRRRAVSAVTGKTEPSGAARQEIVEYLDTVLDELAFTSSTEGGDEPVTDGLIYFLSAIRDGFEPDNDSPFELIIRQRRAGNMAKWRDKSPAQEVQAVLLVEKLTIVEGLHLKEAMHRATTKFGISRTRIYEARNDPSYADLINKMRLGYQKQATENE